MLVNQQGSSDVFLWTNQQGMGSYGVCTTHDLQGALVLQDVATVGTAVLDLQRLYGRLPGHRHQDPEAPALQPHSVPRLPGLHGAGRTGHVSRVQGASRGSFRTARGVQHQQIRPGSAKDRQSSGTAGEEDPGPGPGGGPWGESRGGSRGGSRG